MLQVVIACRCDVWIGTFFTYTTKVEGNCIYAANKSNVGNMPFFQEVYSVGEDVGEGRPCFTAD